MLVVQEFYYNMPRYVFCFALFFSYQTCLEFRSCFKLQTQVCIYSRKFFIYFGKVTVSHPSFTSVSLWKTYYSSAKSLDPFMSVFHFLHLFLFCSSGDFFYLTFLVTNVNINRVHSFLQFTYCLFVCLKVLFIWVFQFQKNLWTLLRGLQKAISPGSYLFGLVFL